MGLAKVGHLCQAEHLYFLLAFVLNLTLALSQPHIRQDQKRWQKYKMTRSVNK